VSSRCNGTDSPAPCSERIGSGPVSRSTSFNTVAELSTILRARSDISASFMVVARVASFEASIRSFANSFRVSTGCQGYPSCADCHFCPCAPFSEEIACTVDSCFFGLPLPRFGLSSTGFVRGLPRCFFSVDSAMVPSPSRSWRSRSRRSAWPYGVSPLSPRRTFLLALLIDAVYILARRLGFPFRLARPIMRAASRRASASSPVQRRSYLILCTHSSTTFL